MAGYPGAGAVDVGKDKWGTKRLCQECDSKFYDMNKTPAICSACKTVFQPKPAKPARPKPRGPVATVVAGKSPDAAVANDADDAGAGKTDDEATLASKGTAGQDGDSAEGLIEDASELGEDEDDMAEVLDTGSDKKEAQT